MTIDVQAFVDGIASHAAGSGYFSRVQNHEPKSAPAAGITAAVWVQEVRPNAARSTLASSAAVIVFNLRVYQSFVSEPQDAIDPAVLSAVLYLMEQYHGDFTLGDQVYAVDLLGATGTPLRADAGYLNIDGKIFRVMTVTIPLMIDDIWTQAP